MAQKEADNTYNQDTDLNQIRVCNHHGQPSSFGSRRAKKLPSAGRADRCCPAAPPTAYHIPWPCATNYEDEEGG